MLKHQVELDRDAQDRSAAGFTLLELVVVLAVLAGLVAVVVYSVSGIESRSQKSTCQTSARRVRAAEETKFADDGTYVADVAALAPKYVSDAPDPDLVTAEGTTPSSLLLTYGPDCRGISDLGTP